MFVQVSREKSRGFVKWGLGRDECSCSLVPTTTPPTPHAHSTTVARVVDIQHTMSTQPRLPNELIELSLSFLTPGAKSSVRALLRCQAVSKGVASIAASPKLWQPHTEQWNTRSISNDDDTDSLEPTTASRTVAQTAEEDGGQRYYRYRAMRDLEAIKLLHELCASTNNHIQYITKLAALGQDVLDVLSEFHEGPIEGKHALSMRYWSVIASGVILRAEGEFSFPLASFQHAR